MTAAILNITFDCRDASALAAFWRAVTGYEATFEAQPGNAFWVVARPNGAWPRLVFVTVPEVKTAKNRVHLDIVPDGCEQDQEVRRLLELGATLVDDRRDATPGGWVVLADPEGNEFCVE
ncbi:MAG TPA: VOC family protein [Candidatus Micrarchaeia archaeon]|nr:VOC family protein [Candidatus Micrarchaeia archaeon]